MHWKIVIICYFFFLTLTYGANEATTPGTITTQQVNITKNGSSTNITANIKEPMEANASKVTPYIEGGPAKINKTNLHTSQEHSALVNSTSVQNSTGTSNVKTATNATMTDAETTMLRPFGREHVVNEPSHTNSSRVIPVNENTLDSVTTNTDHQKTISARKGVTFPDDLANNGSISTNSTISKPASTTAMSINSTSSTSSTTTTTSTTTTSTTTTTTTTTPKPPPKKPLVTVGNNDEPFAPSHFQSSKKNSSSKTVPKVPTIESYEYSRSKSSSSDYVVPIVGVILSVPLVSILLNLIYKKSKEWWHHRHYSRMDFLIDGMYNN